MIINIEYWVPKRNVEAFYQDVNKFMEFQPIEKGLVLAKNVFLTSTPEIAIEVMKLVWKHNGDTGQLPHDPKDDREIEGYLFAPEEDIPRTRTLDRNLPMKEAWKRRQIG